MERGAGEDQTSPSGSGTAARPHVEDAEDRGAAVARRPPERQHVRARVASTPANRPREQADSVARRGRCGRGRASSRDRHPAGRRTARATAAAGEARTPCRGRSRREARHRTTAAGPGNRPVPAACDRNVPRPDPAAPRRAGPPPAARAPRRHRGRPALGGPAASAPPRGPAAGQLGIGTAVAGGMPWHVVVGQHPRRRCPDVAEPLQRPGDRAPHAICRPLRE